ncbi:hypothetical protein CFC21_013649 [Triticum aestivum]|uniref:Uncharacterized protein n=3 Tax=Triticum aestivum TaxID=4565 RepID=A0A9R1IY88_WHEAT|nr:hypothetical protein CFC21_013644 [Triticum aestivum]KAF6997426.1 hypothetical protein CFC21_013645 [Triticum aestivum]KAF6997430.1 hypothetical protein CFC21_013649 [Triticum aestivum]
MADLTGRSMEPAVWPPCDFHLADWSMEPAGAAWVADEFVWSTEMLGTCFQTYVPSSPSGGQLQQVQYAAATQKSPCEEEAHPQNKMEMEIRDPMQVFEKTAHEFEVDIDMFDRKMHRYPGLIRRLSDGNKNYTTPVTVAIGPYYHGKDHLKPAEKVKYVAAYHCIMESGHSVQEMYDAVVSVAGEARGLYDKDVMAGISDNDFEPMMFYDACFLVQFMLKLTGSNLNSYLSRYFKGNMNDIFRDILLLENQLPWRVVETVMWFRQVSLPKLVNSLKNGLQDRKVRGRKPLDWEEKYKPPHLLGLVRFYIVGRSKPKPNRQPLPRLESVSISVGAMELAESGIMLTANKTSDLVDMGIDTKGPFCAELSLAPLSLNDLRSVWLVNMAAFELSTTLEFQGRDAEDEASAVCSYLLLLAMFVDKEEDVHQLRTQSVLQGGGGLTNKEALSFFTSLQDLPLGSRYVRTMREIENYRNKQRRKRTRCHAFFHKNWRIMATVFSAVAALITILSTLASLKKQ